LARKKRKKEKRKTSSIHGFPKFVVLLIDLVLRVSVYEMHNYFKGMIVG
jgi:hypothetical protein